MTKLCKSHRCKDWLKDFKIVVHNRITLDTLDIRDQGQSSGQNENLQHNGSQSLV